jgi:DNA-binding transcriptional LysR family regulator
MISNVFTLKQLEALVWVADLGTFRKAAAHLNTTQPNISSRIAGLEASLGVVLMQRDAGSVRMTAKGEEILLEARKILRQAEDLVGIAERPDLIEDRLRLGVTELVASTWLHTYLRRLKDVYPSVSVELTVNLSRDLDRELSARTLDLTIQTAPFASKASGLIELGKFEYVWVGTAGVLDGLTGRVRVADLIPRSILTHARNTQAYGELVEYAEERGVPTTRFVPSNSMAACVQMAINGLGIALLPRSLVQSELEAGTLQEVQTDWTPAPLRFAARYQAERVAGYVAHSARLADEVLRNL